jgi:uncharacterized protein (TIGR02246 family)
MHDNHAEIRQLALAYAQAMDRNRPEAMPDLFTSDATLAGPGFEMNGLAQIRQVPAMLAQTYLLTRHLVHNQTLDVDGDTAKGETYCVAHHLANSAVGEVSSLIWHLRYDDEYRRTASGWRFSRRRLVLDFTETRLVQRP